MGAHGGIVSPDRRTGPFRVRCLANFASAEGVGKAGGLNDALAEPAAIFLYRGETRDGQK